jgi:hypothetical protein
MRRGVDDGDARRLIKIVFWGILLLLGIRLALALILMIRYRSAPATNPTCCCIADSGTERCAGRLQGRGDTVKDCSTVRLIPIASSQGSRIR